jgi:hypothetical protein
LIDEHSRECLTIDVKRRLNSEDVIDRLTQLFCSRECLTISEAITGRNLLHTKFESGLNK